MKSYLFSVFFVLVFAFEALGMSQQQRIERNMVALLDAIMDRNIEDVREYLPRVGTYTRYKYEDGKYHVYHFNSNQGIPVLSHAVVVGDIETVEFILSRRAGLDDTEEDGRTPLMRAAGAGRAEMVELLLEAGARPYIKEEHGANALMFAVGARTTTENSLRMIEFLLEAGIDINERDNEGHTALDYAIEIQKMCKGECNTEIVDLLIEKGATSS